MKNKRNVMKIKAIMEYYGYNQKDMAEKIGVLQTNLSEMFLGKRACGNGIMAKVQIAFPEINTKWLSDEETEMLKPTNSGDITIADVHNSSISNVGHGNTYTIPDGSCPASKETCTCAIYPVVPTHVLRAPDTNIAEWIEENIDNCKKIDIKQAIGKVSHAQPMTSRAMEPYIPEGAMLFMREVDSWDEALLDGSVYGVDVNRPHMIVRKVYDEGDFVRCEPVNPEFGPVRVPKSKVMNLYKIAAVLKICD